MARRRLARDQHTPRPAEAVHGPGIRETNARLIAAAPELLAALRWAMRELGERGVTTAEYRNARAVIANASGN